MDTQKAAAPVDVKTEKAAADVKACSNEVVLVAEMDMKYWNGVVVVEVDMPGMKSGDIKVEVAGEDNVVTVIGKRKRDEELEKEGAPVKSKYLVKERRVGKFMRTFKMGKNVKTDSISALYHQGVLTLTIQRFPPTPPPKPKTIDVKFA